MSQGSEERARGLDVVVVGAGVSGLTCAVSLIEAGADVLVRTSAPSSGTVSAVAGAMLGPVFGDAGDPSFLWAMMSARRFAELAEVPGTGVTVRRGRLLSAPELGPGIPPWAETVTGFAPCAEEDLPARNPAGCCWAVPASPAVRTSFPIPMSPPRSSSGAQPSYRLCREPP